MHANERAYYLSLDQGGSSSRAIVFDDSGQLVAMAQCAVATHRPRPGFVEQDPTELVTSLQQVAAAAFKQLSPPQQARLHSAALITQRSSLLCWHRQTGVVLSPVLSWQDTRAASWLQAQHWDHQAIYALTGLYPNAHFGISKLRWCLEHLSAVQAASAEGGLCMAPLASYLAYALLLEQPLLVDPANASRTLLMSLARLNWDDQLLNLAAIERHWLPAIVPSQQLYGHLVLGDRRIPLRLLNGDQSAAAFSNGWPQGDDIYMNIGTGAFCYRHTEQPDYQHRLLNSIAFVNDDHKIYLLEGTVNGAGAALSLFAEQHPGINIEALLAQRWADSEHLAWPYYLNGVGGLGSPFWRSDFSSHFVADKGCSAEQRAMAVAESIVFLLYENFSLMKTPDTRRVVVSGGISASSLVCQWLANICQLPVLRGADTEASAKGAAFLLCAEKLNWSLSEGDMFMPVAGQLINERFCRWRQHLQQALQ